MFNNKRKVLKDSFKLHLNKAFVQRYYFIISKLKPMLLEEEE